MSTTQIALPNDHPMVKAWNSYIATDEFRSALKWALAIQYDDGPVVPDSSREDHVKGAMWLSFTKGMEYREDLP